MLEDDASKLSGLGTYIDGKMKRYYLLFAVNGGAFAVAELLLNPAKTPVHVDLTLLDLATGAAAFTIVMTLDIWSFGEMMRRNFLGNLAFTIVGQIILVLMAVLLITGWGLAAASPGVLYGGLSSLAGGLAALWVYLFVRNGAPKQRARG